MNLEEQLASMKATLERLCKESAQKDAQIRRQNKQIADLTKKLEKRPLKASNEGHKAKGLARSQTVVMTLMKSKNQRRIHPCIYYQLSKFKAW